MKLRKLTLTAVLTAAALVMFVLESQLPPLTAIPGISRGSPTSLRSSPCRRWGPDGRSACCSCG